jgi:hypothetical protein
MASICADLNRPDEAVKHAKAAEALYLQRQLKTPSDVLDSLYRGYAMKRNQSACAATLKILIPQLQEEYAKDKTSDQTVQAARRTKLAALKLTRDQAFKGQLNPDKLRTINVGETSSESKRKRPNATWQSLGVSDAAVLKLCGQCGVRETEIKQFQRCDACKSVSYCTRECQISDWKAKHKHECKELAQRAAWLSGLVENKSNYEPPASEIKDSVFPAANKSDVKDANTGNQSQTAKKKKKKNKKKKTKKRAPENNAAEHADNETAEGDEADDADGAEKEEFDEVD